MGVPQKRWMVYSRQTYIKINDFGATPMLGKPLEPVLRARQSSSRGFHEVDEFTKPRKLLGVTSKLFISPSQDISGVE